MGYIFNFMEIQGRSLLTMVVTEMLSNADRLTRFAPYVQVRVTITLDGRRAEQLVLL